MVNNDNLLKRGTQKGLPPLICHTTSRDKNTVKRRGWNGSWFHIVSWSGITYVKGYYEVRLNLFMGITYFIVYGYCTQKKVHSVSSNHDLDRDWRRPWCIKISVIHKKIGWHSIWESKLTHTVCNVLQSAVPQEFHQKVWINNKATKEEKHLTSEQFYIYFLAHIYVLVICIHTFLAVCNGHVCNEGHCS